MKLTTLLLAVGLSQIPTGLTFINPEEALQIEQDIMQLEEIALRCGTRESKLPPWDQYSHDEYSLRVGSSLFIFKDGNGRVLPNGKIDVSDGIFIGRNSIWMVGYSRHYNVNRIPTYYDTEIGKGLQYIINNLKNNLPKECYKNDFNCC